jgi:23S rRNA pseudouridine2605 synthase
MLLTNDGGLARGVTIDGMVYGAVEAAIDRVQGSNLWLTLGLREGKNREARRVLEHLGLAVTRLIRISYGPFQLGDLKRGEVREVRGRVLRDQLGERLARAAGADFAAPIRPPAKDMIRAVPARPSPTAKARKTRAPRTAHAHRRRAS